MLTTVKIMKANAILTADASNWRSKVTLEGITVLLENIHVSSVSQRTKWPY